MTDADIERVLKHVYRRPLTAGDDRRLYVLETTIRAVLQAAIDLDIVCLNEGRPSVLPYSH